MLWTYVQSRLWMLESQDNLLLKMTFSNFSRYSSYIFQARWTRRWRCNLLVWFFSNPSTKILLLTSVLFVIKYSRNYRVSLLRHGVDSLQITFHALILSKVEYALPAIAGLLSETDKSGLDAFFKKQNNVVFAILIYSALNSSTEQIANSKLIQLSHHCFNPLLLSSRIQAFS